MDMSHIVNEITVFMKANPLLTLAAAGVLLFLMYLRPKFFFSVLLLAAILSGVLYVILTMSSTGVSQKKKLIEKEKMPAENIVKFRYFRF
jgi:Ca2+/Na+ antiporter